MKGGENLVPVSQLLEEGRWEVQTTQAASAKVRMAPSGCRTEWEVVKFPALSNKLGQD